MRKKVVLNSPRLMELRRKKHKTARKKTIIFLIIIFIIVVAISFASRITAFNIDKIVISGNKIIETKDIESIVKNEIAGDYLWIFPKTNFLIYPKHQILNELNSKYKRLKSISINVDKFKTLEVSVSEYEGKYLWCGATIPAPTSSLKESCYFMDSSGYVFDQAPYFSGSIYFKFYGNGISKTGDPSGSYFMKSNFAKIIGFKNTIEKLDLKPTAFWTDENREEGNFAISGTPGVGPYIIFKINTDYEKLAENLQAAISTDPLRSDLKSKFNSLQYLDLRYDNKVYFKFK